MSGDLVTNAGTVLDIAEQALGIFSIFPLNIMVVGGIVGMGIALVKGFIPKKPAR